MGGGALSLFTHTVQYAARRFDARNASPIRTLPLDTRPRSRDEISSSARLACLFSARFDVKKPESTTKRVVGGPFPLDRRPRSALWSRCTRRKIKNIVTFETEKLLLSFFSSPSYYFPPCGAWRGVRLRPRQLSALCTHGSTFFALRVIPSIGRPAARRISGGAPLLS